MITTQKFRELILNKVKKLSDDKLTYLDSFLEDLESQPISKKTVMSFGGVFKDLQLSELTSDLHAARNDGNIRVPQF